ncbi:adenosylhomocysteinase [Anaeramoeba ignava]|uniref:adenosylhomocysteinase n=1 Tax=Anaeramoeba ignava TaxID=1746090 RepID=A0A9Q0LAQ6_ANAIG|nr:adenosylhomocysteinase [Anaeramoeba ignava]
MLNIKLNIKLNDPAAAAIVVGKNGTPEKPEGVPIFAWKGESVEEYWEYTAKALDFGDGKGPNCIVDDGGDATLLIHQGYLFEEKEIAPDPSKGKNREEKAIFTVLLEIYEKDPKYWHKIVDEVYGCSEETTTGVHRLEQMEKKKTLLFPAIDVNNSVTKSKFDNTYGCRHSLPDGIMRATDVMIGGKTVVIAGYGDVGKGCAEAMRGQGARVVVTEIDPICALQAAMDGFEVRKMNSLVKTADIFVTCTGCKKVVTIDHMRQMKDGAIVGNIGHFDHEIDMDGLYQDPDVVRENIKPQYDRFVFKDGHGVHVLAEGRLLNLGCATGHPSFVMSFSFSNQVLAQLMLVEQKGKLEKKVYNLPKHLDEKVARLHLGHLGIELEALTEEQSKYLEIPIEGPFKSENYRY